MRMLYDRAYRKTNRRSLSECRNLSIKQHEALTGSRGWREVDVCLSVVPERGHVVTKNTEDDQNNSSKMLKND